MGKAWLARGLAVVAALGLAGACGGSRRRRTRRRPRTATCVTPPRARSQPPTPGSATCSRARPGGFLEHTGATWTSPGWREAEEGRFGGLGARLPLRADAALTIGVSRIARFDVNIGLQGAAGAILRAADGRVTYADAYPSTDVLFVAERDRVEELVLLRSAAAPSTFSWRVGAAASRAPARAGRRRGRRRSRRRARRRDAPRAEAVRARRPRRAARRGPRLVGDRRSRGRARRVAGHRRPRVSRAPRPRHRDRRLAGAARLCERAHGRADGVRQRAAAHGPLRRRPRGRRDGERRHLRVRRRRLGPDAAGAPAARTRVPRLGVRRPAREETVLFGGFRSDAGGDTVCTNDVWTWDEASTGPSFIPKTSLPARRTRALVRLRSSRDRPVRRLGPFRHVGVGRERLDAAIAGDDAAAAGRARHDLRRRAGAHGDERGRRHLGVRRQRLVADAARRRAEPTRRGATHIRFRSPEDGPARGQFRRYVGVGRRRLDSAVRPQRLVLR